MSKGIPKDFRVSCLYYLQSLVTVVSKGWYGLIKNKSNNLATMSSAISFHDFKCKQSVLLSLTVTWIFLLYWNVAPILPGKRGSAAVPESFVMMRTELAFTPEKSDVGWNHGIRLQEITWNNHLTFHGHERWHGASGPSRQKEYALTSKNETPDWKQVARLKNGVLPGVIKLTSWRQF